MYDQSSVWIASGLFLSMLLSMEIGLQIGRRKAATVNESTKSQINAIQASMLGLLALVLGFTFSLALQRYDDRSQTVVKEANAIRTTYLRAQLLPVSMRDELQTLVRRYLDIRIQESRFTLVDTAIREPLLLQTNQMIEELWRYARRAAEEDVQFVTSGLFIQSLNELIDAFGTSDAVLNRHIPEIVFFLLFVTFAMTATILGCASGIAGNRPPFATIVLVALIVLVTFMVIDLDRPRRGLIQISYESLISLQQTIEHSHSHTAQLSSPPDVPVTLDIVGVQESKRFRARVDPG